MDFGSLAYCKCFPKKGFSVWSNSFLVVLSFFTNFVKIFLWKNGFQHLGYLFYSSCVFVRILRRILAPDYTNNNTCLIYPFLGCLFQSSMLDRLDLRFYSRQVCYIESHCKYITIDSTPLLCSAISFFPMQLIVQPTEILYSTSYCSCVMIPRLPTAPDH